MTLYAIVKMAISTYVHMYVHALGFWSLALSHIAWYSVNCSSIFCWLCVTKEIELESVTACLTCVNSLCDEICLT